MKRTITALLLALVVACGAMALTACSNGKYSETFIGAVSEVSYSTKEKAAEAFIDNEIKGLAIDARYIGYEKTEDLTEEQIDSLAIDENMRDRIVAVEKVKVSYIIASTLADDTNISTVFPTQDIYIITITPLGETYTKYHYYVLPSENGDTLTKSYFEDIFDPSKYKNYTQSYKATVGGISVGGYKIKVADDKASIVLDSTYSSASNFSEGYFTQSGGTFETYLKMNDAGTWNSNAVLQVMSIGDTSIIKSMDQFVTICKPKNLDYSWFEKTDFGFKMKSELIGVYVADILSQNGYSDAENVSADFLAYIKEGRIYKMTTNVTVKVFATKIKIQSETLEFDKFGTTVVKKPKNFPY